MADDVKNLNNLISATNAAATATTKLGAASKGTNKVLSEQDKLFNKLLTSYSREIHSAENLSRVHSELKRKKELLNRILSVLQSQEIKKAKMFPKKIKAITTLINREDKYKKILEKSNRLGRTNTKSFKDANAIYDRTKKKMDDIASKYNVTVDNLKDLAAAYTTTGDNLDKYKESLKEIEDLIKVTDPDIDTYKSIESLEEYNKAMRDSETAYDKYLEWERARGNLTEEGARESKKEFMSWEQRERRRSKILQDTGSELRENIEAYEEMARLKERGAMGKIQEKMVGAGVDVRRGLKGVVEAKGFKEIYDAGKALTTSIGKFKAMREAIAGTAQGASGFVGTLGALAKAFSLLGKVNWVALLISAAIGIMKTLKEMNNFIVKYNKTFTKMYGPTVMIKNVSKSMNEFTNSIFNMNRNLKYGIKSEEILGLFDAMSQGGLSLAGVGQRISGGYNKVIEEAVSISRNFGVTMEEVGKMINDQMLEMRMSLKDVDTAFKTISYDASISGIKSERFYESISAATMALGTYGKYLSDASSMLREFYKTGALGFKDSAKQAEDMISTFKNMSVNQRMALFSMTGGVKKYADIFSRKADKIEKTVAIQQKNVDEMKKRAERMAPGEIKDEILRQIAVAEGEIRKQMSDVEMMRRAARGDMTAIVTDMAYISEEALGALLDVLKEGQGLDIFNPDDAFTIQNILENTWGFSREAADNFRKTMVAGAADLERSGKNYSKLISTVPEEKREAVKGILDKYIESGVIDLDKLKDEVIKSGGITRNTIDEFLKLVEKNAYAMKSALEGIAVSREDFVKQMKERIQIVGGTKEAEKRMDDLIKNTTSIADYIGIGKENLEYMRAMLAGGKIQEVIATATMFTARSAGRILGWVETIATDSKDKRTDADFKKSATWKRILILTRTQARLIEELKNENLSEEERKRLENKLNLAITGRLAEVGERRQHLLTDADIQIQNEIKEGAKLKETKGTIAVDDYKTLSDGLQYLRKGEVVIDEKKMSEGIKGVKGQFMPEAGGNIKRLIDTAITSMYKTQIGGQSITVPLTVKVDTINGDADDFFKKIGPAIEQTFERMFFEKQKRGG